MRQERYLVGGFLFFAATAFVLTACGPRVPLESQGSGSFSATQQVAPAPSATPTPIKTPIADDDSNGTQGLFLGATCLPNGPLSCNDFAKVLRHNIAIGDEFTTWNTDLVWYMHDLGMDTWPKQQIIPEITWEPLNVNYSDINAGKWDAYITQQARELRAFGSTVFLRPFHEYNGFWWTWGLANQGSGSQIDAEFINAWQRMVRIFHDQGAHNVKFVWCFSSSALAAIKSKPWDSPAVTYPGDQYVDWVSFDGYNRGAQNNHQPWQTFDQLFKAPYELAYSIAPLKPMSLSEVASNEYGDGGTMKANWITQMFTELTGPNNPYGHLRMVSWYEASGKFAYWTESSNPAYTAFVNDIRATDQYGNLLVRSNGTALAQIVEP